METSGTYERYPAWIVILSSLVSLLIYASGFVIMLKAGLIVALAYIFYILVLEYSLLSRHCVNCYYWGKRCGFGQGSLSSLFFKKGDQAKFCSQKFEWKDMIPDLLVSLIPLVTAIACIIIEFDPLILFAAIILILFSTICNQFIRGSLTCKYCKQRELGCPAAMLFNKEQ